LTCLTSLAPVASAAPLTTGPDAAQAVIVRINLERSEAGVSALVEQDELALAARRHARDMVRRHYFSHTTLGGRSMVDRLLTVGYLGPAVGRWSVGEVLAWGTGPLSTPAAAVAAWMRSPVHRRTLLSAAYREVGVGVQPGTPTGRASATYAAELGVTGR
jgi:uncharacterized protein YkwD